MSVQKGIGTAKANPYRDNDGRVLVSRVAATADVKDSILKAVDLIGGFDKAVAKGDTVLLKPNYNSGDPPPASSEPQFVRAAIELLYEHGAGKIILGESSMQSLSTRHVMERTGTLATVKDSGAETVFFDEGRWVKVNVGGEYLKSVYLPERALSVDKVVYLCNMKTHFRADFSLSLKLAFGMVKGSERLGFHIIHLKEKLVDLNLVVHPDLIIMDGRKCFITGGPFSGDVREPGLILASGDRVAIDIEAIKVIRSFRGSRLKDDPWSYTQIKQAIKLGLGVKNEEEYRVING